MIASYQQELRKFATLLVFALPAMALTVKSGLGIVQLFMLLSLAFPQVRACYVPHFRTIAYIVVGFVGYFLISLFRMQFFGQSLNTLDGPSRLLFGLSCIGFVVGFKPSHRWFCWGLCVGAIGAGALALVQRLVFGIDRVDGFTHHPISFGDLSLATGLLALCTLSEFRGTRWIALPWLALMAGMLGSIFSGSRGGWLALPLVVWPLLIYGRALYGKAILWSLGFFLGLTVLAYIVPATGVAFRLAEAVSNVQGYMQSGDATTSVGIRLELWKASWLMFSEHPLMGVGRDQFENALQQLAAQGQLQMSPALNYSSSHNDMLHFLATGGLLDFSCLLLMYGAPAMFFVKILQQPSHPHQISALMGLVLVLSFIAFSLTDAMFWLMMPKVYYVMMTSVLIGFCLTAQELHD
jgi:O-antigen ligase